MGLRMAGIPRNLWVSRGYGSECCGNTTGAGIPRGWIWQLRDSRGDGFFFCEDPTGMVEKFQSAYSIQTDQINALTSIE